MQEVVLTVYPPDTLKARLERELDEEIAALGAEPIERCLVGYSAELIEKFYSDSVGKNVPRWHLVVSLFTSGPSIATVWRGDGIQATAMALKGSTHPANAPESSIRGRYCCDNAVTNLIHVSDPHRFQLEAALLGIDTSSILELPALPLCGKPPQAPWPTHSGIYTLVTNVRFRLAMKRSGTPEVPIIDLKAAARTSYAALRDYARRLADWASANSAEAGAIAAYLAGDAVDCTAALTAAGPLHPWDELVIRSGCTAAGLWSNS